MSLKQTFAQIITRQRQKYGLTQDKVAADAGLSNRFYRSIESGGKMPSISSTLKIAKAMDIHYSELMEPLWEYWLEHPEEIPED